MNLALADVRVLFEAIYSFCSAGSREFLDAYSDTALQRVWQAQNFAYWLTNLLHTHEDSYPFERKRALGELATITKSRYAQQYLAESYTGWPHG